MILQIDPRLRPEIQEFGCYLMSVLFFVNKYTNLPLSPDIINQLYTRFIPLGWMDEQCTILNPNAIFGYLKLPVLYHDRYDPPDYICKPDEIEILKWENGNQSHFTAGNGHGIVTYDPMGCAKTVKYGKLVSKRVFRLLSAEAC